MRIQYASDLHLEYKRNWDYLLEHPIEVMGEVLVLAGDIGYLGDDKTYTSHPFWDWASEHYRQVIVVPGNHEFYQFFDIETLHDGWVLPIRHNVHCYYNCVIHLDDDIDVIATTLWSRIAPENGRYTQFGVTDFHRIRSGEESLTWPRFNEEHERCLAFLLEAVNHSKARHIVVVSHHVPTFKLIYPEFANKSYSGAFAVELESYIEQSPIDYWIFGHSHYNIGTQIGKTQLVCDQLGYIHHGEHQDFLGNKFVTFEE